MEGRYRRGNIYMEKRNESELSMTTHSKHPGNFCDEEDIRINNIYRWEEAGVWNGAVFHLDGKESSKQTREIEYVDLRA